MKEDGVHTGESHILWQIQVAKRCSGEDKAHDGVYALRQVSLSLRRGSESTLHIIGKVRNTHCPKVTLNHSSATSFMPSFNHPVNIARRLDIG